MSDNNTTLCDTAKLLCTVLDGASERAVLLDQDGTVLHRNAAAAHFLQWTPHNHVSDFLVYCDNNESWKEVETCRIVLKQTGKPTRSERHIHMARLSPCVCCQRTYYTAYICSKHERVREVVDIAFDSVLTVNEEGIIVTVNEAAMKLFGYTESEMVGHAMSIICHGQQDQQEEFMRNIRNMIGQQQQVTCLKKNGNEFICELGIQEITDASSGKRYYCGFLRDLTVLKQQEAEIQDKEELAQAMINASFDSMMEIDEMGKIQIVNDAACSMFGYTREEFLGSNISMICGNGHAEHHCQYMQRYLREGGKRVIGRKRQVHARRKDGSELEVELGVQEVILTNGKRAFCGYIRDLTEQKKDKRALRKQQQVIQDKFFGATEEEVAEGEK